MTEWTGTTSIRMNHESTTELLAPVPSTRLVASTDENGDHSHDEIDLGDSSSYGSDSSGSSGNSDSTSIGLTAAKDYGTSNFSNLLWSADGTSVITTSADNVVRSFILPPGLLDRRPSRLQIDAYSSHSHPVPIYAAALSPFYNISSPETTLILTSPSGLPIRLTSPFVSSILASYPLVNPDTERWIAPHSLIFTVPYATLNRTPDENSIPDNTLRFLAGSQNQISVFDISRDGSGPMTILQTSPSNRKARRGGSNGMTGIVSAMAMSCEGILAAGTFSRGIGLYDAQGMGDTIGTWSLSANGPGSGVTSVHWSRCGRYLVVAERGSDGFGVWDVRGTGRRLAWLNGRRADTMQRLGIALGNQWNNPDGGEDVFGGGSDGCVRVWSGLGCKEGDLESDWNWKAHEDVVSGIGIHTCGSVVATCSGSRQDVKDDLSEIDSDDSEVESGSRCSSHRIDKVKDNSLRVWSFESLQISGNSA